MSALELIESDEAAPVAPARAGEPDASGRKLSVVEYAVQAGASVAEVRALLELQVQADQHKMELIRERRRMEEEDRKAAAVLAYRRDFAAFRGENIIVPKSKHVDRGRAGSFNQAEYHTVASMLSPALARHGFGFRHNQVFGSREWPTAENPAARVGWVTVTCYLEHRDGHVETLELEGPEGDQSANTPVQNMQLTASYLKRQSLLAITGTATGGEDDESRLRRREDGVDGAPGVDPLEVWSGRAALAQSLEELGRVSKDGAKEFRGAGDADAYRAFAAAVQARGAALRAGDFVRDMEAAEKETRHA